MKLTIIAVLVMGALAAPKKDAPATAKDESKPTQPKVDSETAKKMADLGKQTRNITARWKQYPHRQRRNQTALLGALAATKAEWTAAFKSVHSAPVDAPKEKIAPKDEPKSKVPKVSMDTETAKKFDDLANQTRNITTRWKRYPHRQERNQTTGDYHNISFCGKKVPRKFRHFFKNQTEEDILGPVDKRSYNLFRATRTGSALQKKSNLRAKQVPGSDQKLAEGGAAGKVAGKEPFATVLKDGYWPVGCYTDKMVTSADKFGDEKDKYNDLAGVSIALYDELLDKADHKPMTPTVCFEFCSTLPAMVFFGITEGRKCYCTPYFSPGPGNADKCDSVCEGDTTLMCGTTSGRSSVFEMHLCGP